LAFNDQHFVMLVGQHQLLRRAIDEVGDDPINRAAVPLDQDAGLASGHELGVHTAAAEFPGDFQRRHHFSHAAIVGHRLNAQASFADALPLGHIALVVLAHVHQSDAVAAGCLGKLRIVAQKVVQAGDHIQPAADGLQNYRPPRQGYLAPRRGDANQQRPGLRHLSQRTHHRDIAADA